MILEESANFCMLFNQAPCFFLTEGESEERLKLYTEILEKHPRASMPKCLPLTFVTGKGSKFKSKHSLAVEIRFGYLRVKSTLICVDVHFSNVLFMNSLDLAGHTKSFSTFFKITTH